MITRVAGIIDAHQHLWDPRLHDHPWLSKESELNRAFYPSDLLDAVTQAPIEGTVVVQAASSTNETDWLLDLARESELILGVVGWVDLVDPMVGDRIAELAGQPLVGVRHQVEDEPDPAWLTRPAVIRGIRAVGDSGLPFDLLVREPQRAAALRLVARMPNQRFVIDHLAKPDVRSGEWSGWREWMAAMASHANVSCKISGLITQADWAAWKTQSVERYIAEAIDVFGVHRCMFGSDWPVALLAGEYGEILELVERSVDGLSAAERDALWRRTPLPAVLPASRSRTCTGARRTRQ